MGHEHRYPVSMEVAGPLATWIRPDSGDSMVSYPAPPYSAVKGIFEKILRLRQAVVVPTKVEICRPVIWTQYTTNYGGPLRKADQRAKGANYQMVARILMDVCYRMYAVVHHEEFPKAVQFRRAPRTLSTNGGHAYQEIFNRRLKRGQSFDPVCLGWTDFKPDYVGPRREETQPCQEVSFDLETMLKTPFGEEDGKGGWTSEFYQDVHIEKGVLKYA